MVKAVIDTSVFIAGLISKTGSPRIVINALNEGLFIPVTSPAIMEELDDVLSRPKFHPKIKDVEAKTLMENLLRNALIVEPKISLKVVLPDPQDDMFLEAALAGRTNCVVSLDNHLLDIRTYRGVEILTPKEFLKRIK